MFNTNNNIVNNKYNKKIVNNNYNKKFEYLKYLK